MTTVYSKYLQKLRFRGKGFCQKPQAYKKNGSQDMNPALSGSKAHAQDNEMIMSLIRPNGLVG